MTVSNSVNHNPTFPIPNADTDAFSSEMLEITLSALDLDDHSLNKGPPVKRINSGLFASRPAAGNAGHVYVATDTHQLFFDNGGTWYTVVAEGVTISATGIVFTNNTGKISFLDSGGTARQAIYSTNGDTLRIYPSQSGGNIAFRNFADTLNNFVFSDAGLLTLTTVSIPNNTGTYQIQDSGAVSRTVLQGDATDVVRFKPLKASGHIQIRNFADAVANVDIDEAGNVTALVSFVVSNATGLYQIKDSGGTPRKVVSGTAGDVVTISPLKSTGTIIVRNFADTLNNVIFSDTGGMAVLGRIQGAQGANVTAASHLTLGTDGNFFNVTGATAIDLIDSTGWQAGSAVTLLFASNPVVNHNTAVSGNFKPLILNAAGNFSTAANNTLSLTYNGTSWFETGRKV